MPHEGSDDLNRDPPPTRLSFFLSILAMISGPILGGLIAFVSHPWWFRGGGSFAAIYDFIGGIICGGLLGLALGLGFVAWIGRSQRPPSGKA